MYVYMYIYIYVFVCIYIHTYIYVCVMPSLLLPLTCFFCFICVGLDESEAAENIFGTEGYDPNAAQKGEAEEGGVLIASNCFPGARGGF